MLLERGGPSWRSVSGPFGVHDAGPVLANVNTEHGTACAGHARHAMAPLLL